MTALLTMIIIAATVVFTGCAGKGGKGTGNYSSDSANEKFLSETKPVFSDLGGFYTGELKLTISIPKFYEGSDFEIRVTFNGTEPSGGSDKYNGQPIHLPNDYSFPLPLLFFLLFR